MAATITYQNVSRYRINVPTFGQVVPTASIAVSVADIHTNPNLLAALQRFVALGYIRNASGTSAAVAELALIAVGDEAMTENAEGLFSYDIATAATLPLYRSPEGMVLLGLHFFPNATLALHADNYITLSLAREDTDGTQLSTTVLHATNATAITSGTPIDFSLASKSITLSAGQYLSITSAKTGSPTGTMSGTFCIEFLRT